jgi:hypothetical protein
MSNWHMLISSVRRPEHLALFERGIDREIDLADAVRRAYAWRNSLMTGNSRLAPFIRTASSTLG